MRNTLLAVALSLMLVGCASAPAQMYRPAAHSGAPWQIEGDFNSLTNAITIRINGQEVIAGRLSILQRSAELSGKYDNRPITASCSQSTGLLGTRTQCIVFVANERAATLQF
jgi:hypothetical protein